MDTAENNAISVDSRDERLIKVDENEERARSQTSAFAAVSNVGAAAQNSRQSSVIPLANLHANCCQFNNVGHASIDSHSHRLGPIATGDQLKSIQRTIGVHARACPVTFARAPINY